MRQQLKMIMHVQQKYSLVLLYPKYLNTVYYKCDDLFWAYLNQKIELIPCAVCINIDNWLL